MARGSKSRLIVTGDAALDAKLNALPRKVRDKLARGAMRAALKPMQAQAKGNTPVVSGAFRRGIKVRSGRRSRTALSMGIVVSAADFAGRAYMHPVAVELGTEQTPAQAPLRRAFEQTKAATLATFARVAGADVEQAAKS